MMPSPARSAPTNSPTAHRSIVPPNKRGALHLIAAYEALKGLAALAALLGVLDLMHHDVRHLAMELIGRFGLDPHARVGSMLLHYAELLPAAHVPTIVALALAYVSVRWAEAWGLWNDRAWGEVLGAASGALYVPFELQHLLAKPSWIGAAVLLSNLLLVAYLVWVLQRRRRAKTP